METNIFSINLKKIFITQKIVKIENKHPSVFGQHKFSFRKKIKKYKIVHHCIIVYRRHLSLDPFWCS
jgi:hypothetical protein